MFSPLTYILLLGLTGFFTKGNIRKGAFILAAVVFLFFSNPALFQIYARWYQPGPVELAGGSHYSFGIVAGGFGSVDEKGDGYFNSASDRFLQAVRLYKTGAIDHILISGGNSKKNDKGFREGAWAKQQMIQFGVPGTVIWVEDRSDNTRDNAINSGKILDSLHAKSPFVLITSAFHIPRAKRLYEKAGLEVVAFPCNYTEGRGPVSGSDLIPSATTLLSWPKYIREAAAKIVGR